MAQMRGNPAGYAPTADLGAMSDASVVPKVADRWAFDEAKGPRIVPALPSLAEAENDTVIAEEYLRNLARGHKAYAQRLAVSDPMAAGVALADLDSMKDGYQKLVASGIGEKDAAHAIGVAGSVFGSYANAASNADYLMRFARTRGTDLPSAARELSGIKDNFRAHYLQRYGFQPGSTPDAAVEENIRNDFSELLGALRDTEDRYGWQFNRSTYLDTANRLASIAADLAVSRVSVKDIGAQTLVESALIANGSFRGDPNANAASRLLEAQKRDRARITMFGEEGGVDPFSNPYRSGPVNGVSSKTKALDDSLDFGLSRDIRQAVFDHRARAVRSGLSPDDFSNDYALRSDIVSAFKSQSTSAGGVSDDTFMTLAGMITRGLADPEDSKPLSVVGLARELASSGEIDAGQVAALGRWAKSLTMDSKEGQQRLAAVATPFIMKYAAGAGLSTRDPLVSNFSSQVYRLLRRRYQSLAAAPGLDGVDQIAAMDPKVITQMIDEELKGYTKSLEAMQTAKNDAAAAKAARVAEMKEAVEG